MDEGLAPRVEHREEPDLRAHVAGIGGDGLQGLGDRAEQDAVDDRFVLQGDRRDGGGHGEDDVEVLAVEQVGRAGLDPRGAREALALGTMTIAAGVVPDAPMAAAVALLDMAAERGGPTLRDGSHHAALRRREGGPDPGPKRVAVAAEDRRHGERRARHRDDSVGAGVGRGPPGCGSRSSGLAVEQTVVVAMRRYRAVVARLRCPSRS